MTIIKKKILEQKPFSVFDIETFIDKKQFRLSSVYDGKQCYHQSSCYELLDFILEKSKHDIFYAHYAGGFDTLWLLDEIFRQRVINPERMEFWMSGGIVLSYVFRWKERKIEIRDSFGLFRRKLDTVAEKLVGKNKIDIEIEELDSYSDDEVIKYCDNDCIILYEAINRFLEIINFRDEYYQNLKISCASQAMTFFRQYFLKHEWIKLSKFWDTKLRSWYFGGRVDVFKRYGINIKSYDINNSYGYTMKEYGAPIGLPKQTISYKPNKCNFIHCTIKNYEDNIPVAPVIFSKKLFFPCLKNSHVFITNYEYEYLSDYIDKIHEIYVFDYDKDFFREYIEFWDDLKSKDSGFDFVAKLMEVSLYGKFAEKRIRQKLTYGYNLKSYLSNEFFLGYVDEERIADYHNVQIGAWITSGARYNLYKYLKQNENSLYYCDTDSLMTSNIINPSKKIGELKIEKEMKKAYFLGLKFYGYLNENNEFKSVVKGFEKDIFGIDKFENALNDIIDFKYVKEGFRKLKSSIISANSFISYTRSEKEIQTLSVKRKLINKTETEPFTLVNNSRLV